MYYYQRFNLLLEAWFYVGLVLLVMMAQIAVLQYAPLKEGQPSSLRKRYNDRPALWFEVAGTVIFAIFFIVNSGHGLLQFFLDRVTFDEDPLLADFFFILALAAIIAAYAGLMWLVWKISSWARVGYLMQIIWKRRRQTPAEALMAGQKQRLREEKRQERREQWIDHIEEAVSEETRRIDMAEIQKLAAHEVQREMRLAALDSLEETRAFTPAKQHG